MAMIAITTSNSISVKANEVCLVEFHFIRLKTLCFIPFNLLLNDLATALRSFARPLNALLWCQPRKTIIWIVFHGIESGLVRAARSERSARPIGPVGATEFTRRW